jgi:hypothetical protein
MEKKKKAIEIIDALPHKTFNSDRAFFRRNYQAIKRAGYQPVKATYDRAGNCEICGEAGRCPGWHTLYDVELRKEMNDYLDSIGSRRPDRLF